MRQRSLEQQIVVGSAFSGAILLGPGTLTLGARGAARGSGGRPPTAEEIT